jgi:hypothetical protein
MALVCQIPPGPPFSKGGSVYQAPFSRESSYSPVWARNVEWDAYKKYFTGKDTLLYLRCVMKQDNKICQFCIENM